MLNLFSAAEKTLRCSELHDRWDVFLFEEMWIVPRLADISLKYKIFPLSKSIAFSSEL